MKEKKNILLLWIVVNSFFFHRLKVLLFIKSIYGHSQVVSSTKFQVDMKCKLFDEKVQPIRIYHMKRLEFTKQKKNI